MQLKAAVDCSLRLMICQNSAKQSTALIMTLLSAAGVVIYSTSCKGGAVCFLADRTIGRAFGTVSRLSVVVCRLSVTFCIVAKRCILAKKCLKE